MIPFKGKCKFKNYVKNKPKKWGYKHLYHMTLQVYSTILNYIQVKQNMIMLLHVEINGNLVLCLREIILSNYLHKLHSDNWFTRIQVQAELEKWESSACELSGQMECMAVNSDQKKN
jgi:hypothetical protein